VAFLVWFWFSWPLPRYFASGIPSAAHLEPADVQPLIPGDHLQFMYYCWLAGDMLAGKTPLFCNLYEFNTGEDPRDIPKTEIRKLPGFLAKKANKQNGYRPDPYYFPFSFVYSAGALAGGRAFGWNFTGFISLWMTFFLTWLLVRRYTRESWLAGCAALIAIALPFRWINLFGGSPAGFAMVWIPAIFLGIDLAVRDGKSAGGIMAGLALLLASWTDNHIFFFGALATPFWALVSASAGMAAGRKWKDSWQKIFAALLPIPLFLGGALAFPALMQMLAGTPAANQYLASSVGARTLREIALYSPVPGGFVAWIPSGISSHIYIGFSAAVFLAAGMAGLVFDAWRGRDDSRRQLFIMLLLLAGIAGVMALALGANGPAHAALLKICRKIIPPYAMIRQPAKIFCLMPSFLAVAAGISLGALMVHMKTRRIKIFAGLLFCAAVTGEYVFRVNPTVSILDSKQGAYEAVANDAAAAGKAPHALVVPLWPGDSHQSSIYQHYASLYRVRMVNGYNPFVSKVYFENVFRPYESVNQGCLTDRQINDLLRRQIEYIILHEDLFPEKVSPFPVGWTLKQFLTHKRLRLVKQDGRVWAFKMLAEPKLPPGAAPMIHRDKLAQPANTNKAIQAGVASDAPAKEILPGTNPFQNWETFACARNWQAENCAAGKAQVVRDSLKIQGAYAALREAGSWLNVPALRVAPAPQLRWMVRTRGNGAVLAEVFADGKPVSRDLIDVESDDWEWVDVPVDDFDRFAQLGLKIEHESGAVDCDQILLANGAAPAFSPAKPGQSTVLKAACMFHAGYTSLADDAVVFEKEREAKALIFYGPKLPLEKGRYRIELIFSSDSPRGVLLGQFNVKRNNRDYNLNWTPVMAGARSLTEVKQSQNVPMHLEFLFLGNGSLKISGIKVTRLE